MIAGPRRRIPPRSVPRRLAPWVLAIAVHLMVLVLALRAQPSMETWSARMASTIHAALAAQAPTELDLTPAPLPPPPPPPEEVAPPAASEPAPEVAQASPPPTPAQRARASEPAAPTPPAAAGAVVTSNDAPVDFGDQGFVVGNASAYVGGATTATGTGTQPGVRPSSPASPQTSGTQKSAKARPVRLAGSAWRCPWPSRAIDADIFEQTVVIKVRVGTDGRARDVQIVEDPGLGFGDAAAACARKTRFTPARDDAGTRVAAMSPPIRVRFTR